MLSRSDIARLAESLQSNPNPGGGFPAISVTSMPTSNHIGYQGVRPSTVSILDIIGK